MREAGLPEDVVGLVGDMWRTRVRVLTFEGVAAEEDGPCSCLPQGDPFSPAALGLVLGAGPPQDRGR
eukprot:13257827-Alexandrium_andersonii.AAC.1